MSESTEPFYKNGLRFSCTHCSNCCRHEPGFVFLSQNDLSRLAKSLQLREEEVLDNYCRRVEIGLVSRISLREKANYDCIFWEKDGCIVYSARPLQCKTYPFWHQNLLDRTTWDKLQKDCPGVNSGKKHSFREITKKLDQRRIDTFLS